MGQAGLNLGTLGTDQGAIGANMADPVRDGRSARTWAISAADRARSATTSPWLGMDTGQIEQSRNCRRHRSAWCQSGEYRHACRRPLGNDLTTRARPSKTRLLPARMRFMMPGQPSRTRPQQALNWPISNIKIRCFGRIRCSTCRSRRSRTRPYDITNQTTLPRAVVGVQPGRFSQLAGSLGSLLSGGAAAEAPQHRAFRSPGKPGLRTENMADPFARHPSCTRRAWPRLSGDTGLVLAEPRQLWGQHAVAANARDPEGFLTYGTGIAGPLGEAAASDRDSKQKRQTSLPSRRLSHRRPRGNRSRTLLQRSRSPSLGRTQIGIMTQAPQGLGRQLAGQIRSQIKVSKWIPRGSGCPWTRSNW